MGSYTFKWEHPADEVYVTGTFDNWTKSVKLNKEGSVFQKTVELEDASTKIYYKFVVDGTWVTNETAPKELDHEGNVNNFLAPEDISKEIPASALLNTTTPASTTAKMAGEQPITTLPVEPKVETDPSGTILNTVTPQSTTAALAGQVPLEPKQKPAETPAEELPQETPSDIPGGFPVTPANELDKSFGVNPLPAAAGAINPITLAPGEKIPESVAAQSSNGHVKLDKESYEKSDAIPGLETELPPVSKNTIPESSLPILGSQDVAINTVTPAATTAALAGDVPLESKVPEVVKESQEKAQVPPEASAVPEEVSEKAKVEEELKEKVPEVPPTSEGDKSEEVTLAALAATAGGAVIAAGLAIKDTVQEQTAPLVSSAADTAAPYVTSAADTVDKTLPESVKQSLPVSAQDALATKVAEHKEEKIQEISPEVPAEVKESIVEAGLSPEAAANTEAVEEKKAVEAELLKEVKPVSTEAEKSVDVAPEVPAEVKQSFAKSGESPEAAANTEAVEEKKLVEAELQKSVDPTPAVDTEKKPEETETQKDTQPISAAGLAAAATTAATAGLAAVGLTSEKKEKAPEVAPEVPPAVQESITESGKSPEAAAVSESVEKKELVEGQLLSEVKPTPAVGETEPVKSEETKPVEPEVAPLVPETVAPIIVSTETPKTEETKPQTEAPVSTETPKDVTTTEQPPAETAKTEEAKSDAPVASTGNGAGNGTETKAAGSHANGSSAAGNGTTEHKKKHNRLSSIFSKIKHKFSDSK